MHGKVRGLTFKYLYYENNAIVCCFTGNYI
jgi:hypothetical protein